jgi:hypothetical protein
MPTPSEPTSTTCVDLTTRFESRGRGEDVGPCSSPAMGGRSPANMVAPMQAKPFYVQIATPAISSVRDPAFFHRGSRGGRPRRKPRDGRRAPIAPLEALWSSPRNAPFRGELGSWALPHPRKRRRRVGQREPLQCGRSIHAPCQTDRAPPRSRACADASALRAPCAPPSPWPTHRWRAPISPKQFDDLRSFGIRTRSFA